MLKPMPHAPVLEKKTVGKGLSHMIGGLPVKNKKRLKLEIRKHLDFSSGWLKRGRGGHKRRSEVNKRKKAKKMERKESHKRIEEAERLWWLWIAMTTPSLCKVFLCSAALCWIQADD